MADIPGVWIIEMRGAKDWHPTVGCALTQSIARDVLREWERGNPDDDFRITRYVRREKKHG